MYGGQLADLWGMALGVGCRPIEASWQMIEVFGLGVGTPVGEIIRRREASWQMY